MKIKSYGRALKQLAIIISILSPLSCSNHIVHTHFSPMFLIERPDEFSGTRFDGSLPLVRASINAKEGLFLFDTGATHTVLSENFARSLDLNVVGTVTGNDSGDEIVNGSVLEPATVVVLNGNGAFALKHPVVLSVGPLEKLGISGVISPQSFIMQGCVSIDFNANVAKYDLADSITCNDVSADYTGKIVSPKGIKSPVIELKVIGKSDYRVLFLIDTGAKLTRIEERFLNNIDRLQPYVSSGVSGVVRSSLLAGPVILGMGDYRQSLSQVVAQPDGIGSKLGMDVLGNARIVIMKEGLVTLSFTAKR